VKIVRMRMRLALLLALLPLPVLGQDDYRRLVPLLDIFNPANDTPGYDVVGIRCAGVWYAQEEWTQTHGGRGATRAQLSAGAHVLELAVQHRIGEGRSLTEATLTVEADVLAVIDLYLARFAQNATGGHPWRSDPLVGGDLTYCEIATG